VYGALSYDCMNTGHGRLAALELADTQSIGGDTPRVKFRASFPASERQLSRLGSGERAGMYICRVSIRQHAYADVC
jgi:hypothetical protein